MNSTKSSAGWIKAKALAAARAGIKTVLLPAQNEKDLVDIPASAREKLEFKFLHRMEEALELDLEK
jgi:ATP-dependent Lon protease